ncbi:hypothetical protein KVR01_006397 [Diaporthe batatas]|uniref:uncharacterized protein n=1 Tax=Diaporthe batatas TaxID=748121 RepID=UPI001D05AFFE|nr:uncharacterized protein KVR01_006397 [Diaporthe batatas]KAG8164479.1 hypothetical protein KVR01_006397 [Diaporthe batatas]
MSLGGDDLLKTEELPGAFPSDDAITTETATTGTQQNTKPYPEQELGAHQNVAQVGGANNSGIPSSQGQNIAHAGAEGTPAPSRSTQGTTPSAETRDGAAQPVSTLASAANPLSGPTAAADDNSSLGPDNAPNITEDLKAVGAGAATAVTAAATAARDAAIAAKDAAAPVVSSATEQAMQAAGYATENAGPAASAASEQAKNAALYARDSAVPAANAAVNTVQANAPAALGGGPTANTASPRDVAPEVPGQVKSSLVEAGESPEAASSRRAVHDKGQVEAELLGHARGLGGEDEAATRQFKDQQAPVAKGIPRPPAPGTLARLDSEPQTPSVGAAVVLGTETERSFPLGSHPVHHEGAGTGPDAAETGQLGGGSAAGRPMATDGARAEYDVPQQTGSGDGQSAAAARRPPPVEDKVPRRATEEEAVGTGPGAYQSLSSGTPSGVAQ